MRDAPSFRPRSEELEPREVPAATGLFAIGGGPGGPPRVQVFDTTTGAKLGDFLAYENSFAGGVTTAVADVNSDGIADLIVGAGAGGGPRVRVFNGSAFRPLTVGGVPPAPRDGVSFLPDQFVLADFFAFEASQRGGCYVAAGNFAGATFADLVIGAGPGGGPRVRILDGQVVTQLGRAFTSQEPAATVANFFAFESSFRNGVTVAATTAVFGAAQSDLVVAPGIGGGPRVRVLSGGQISVQRAAFTGLGPIDVVADFFAGDPNSRAGVYVASADFNRDGLADLAVGNGPGVAATVTVYSGALIRQRGLTFTGGLPGDVLDAFQVNAGTDYVNGVTVGAALESSALGGGVLLVGAGGQGRLGQAQLLRYQVGGGFLSRQVVYDITFDPNFAGGVFVSL